MLLFVCNKISFWKNCPMQQVPNTFGKPLFFSNSPYFLKFGHLLYRVEYFPVDF
eukprot:UN02607